MHNCKLCKKNNADKKGSHIVPHFLLKRIENIDSATGRDKDIGFAYNNCGMVSSHFGRAVSPKKLEEIFGTISEKDIDNNKHDLIVDDFFCTECEKRLSIIESEYAKTINKIENQPYNSGVSTLVGLLFWSSILWRMYINGKSYVRLSEFQEEYLRSFLNNYLPDKNIKELETIHNNLQSMSYKLIRFNDCDKDDTKLLSFIPIYDNPLVLLIDEYILAFALEDNYKDFEIKKFCDVEELFRNVEKNTFYGQEVIYPIEKKYYLKIREEILNTLSNLYLDEIPEILDKVYREVFHCENSMPKEIKYEIICKIIYSGAKLGRRHTPEDNRRIICEVLKKYYL